MTTVTDEEFPPLGPRRQTSLSSIPISLQDTRRSTPALPPGLEESIQSRNGTPTRPPGLSKPDDDDPTLLQKRLTALPDLEGTSRPSSRASLRRAVSSQVVPALPIRIGTPTKGGSGSGTPARLVSRPTSPTKAEVVQETPTKTSNAAAVLEDHNAAAKKSIADVVSGRGGSVMEERKHPGKLDISAATQVQDSDGSSDAAELSSVARRMAAQTVTPVAPTSPAVSPAVKAAPRTIRVVQTPKVEMPPIIIPAVMTAVRKLPSRQPSVASMNMPGTPTSEQISDNVSINSMSRASSPPPLVSKVGTAPVRTKTKSQLKKERQEKAKAMDEAKAEAFAHIAVDEPMQEAIVSRKKKTKKGEVKARAKPTAVAQEEEEVVETTPHVSRPASPVEVTPPPVPVVEHIPTPPLVRPGPELSPPATPTLSPVQLITELRSMDPQLMKSFEALFRVPVVSNAKNLHIPAKDLEGHSSWRNTEFGVKLSKEDVNKLLSGYAATLGYAGTEDSPWGRAMITPGGAQLRALSDELEQRFLELEKHIMDLPEELRFRPTKPQNETRFPTMDLKALKKAFDSKGPRGVSVMEQMVQDGSAMKKGAFLVDEVSKYINEFVMPPATPPPSAGRGAASQQQAHSEQAVANAAAGPAREVQVPPVDLVDRQLHEARRAVDDREGALRKVIRKNKKLLGLS